MKKNIYYDYEFENYKAEDFDYLKKFSLGEGQTPLTKAERLGAVVGYSNLYIKHEEQNPTGSFKDRESVVAISLAKKKNLKEIVIASSGNAALSMAAYARKAGITCTCFVPATTSIQKKEMITFFGGKLHEIEGNYEKVYRHVANTFPREINMTSGICSDRVEGNKVIAYEIVKDIGIPDIVVVPCGNGGNLAGIWKGFDELKKDGKISKVPRMIGVQVKGASPIVEALKKQQLLSILSTANDSLAEGIVAEESYCSPKAIQALLNSQGTVIEVDDQEIKDALKLVVIYESLMIEPTSAAAFAALPKLAEHGITSDSKVVVISTGSGMKMLEELMGLI